MCNWSCNFAFYDNKRFKREKHQSAMQLFIRPSARSRLNAQEEAPAPGPPGARLRGVNRVKIARYRTASLRSRYIMARARMNDITRSAATTNPMSSTTRCRRETLRSSLHVTSAAVCDERPGRARRERGHVFAKGGRTRSAVLVCFFASFSRREKHFRDGETVFKTPLAVGKESERRHLLIKSDVLFRGACQRRKQACKAQTSSGAVAECTAARATPARPADALFARAESNQTPPPPSLPAAFRTT